MATLVRDERASDLAALTPGTRVKVTRDDYFVRGWLIGVRSEINGQQVRILADDRLERRIPLPAVVELDG